MALSDCERCWDTPCHCGYYFRDYSKKALIKYVISTISEHPKTIQKEIIDGVLKTIENETIG